MNRKGDVLQLRVVDVAEADKCLARIPGGPVVFIQGPVAVGDLVEARVYKVKKNYLEARMTSILEPAPGRVEPPCSHFGICGGCKWQHVDYSIQCQTKRKLVVDALERIGRQPSPDVAPVQSCPLPYRYRNKIDLTFSNQRFLLDHELGLDPTDLDHPADFALGFHRPGRFNKIIAIDQCHLAPPAFTTALHITRDFFRDRRIPPYSTISHQGFLRNLVLRHALATDQFMVYLITSTRDPALMKDYLNALQARLGTALTTFVNGVTSRKNLVAYAEDLHTDFGPGVITERLEDLSFDIAPNAFFQTNTRQALTLYQTVRDLAELSPTDHVLDLYCGTGTISLFLAPYCSRVTGFDTEPSAIENARVNAARNRRPHAAFFREHLEDLHQALASHHVPTAPQVVITDPPRAGMHEKTTQSLIELAPRRIIYVSCNPASLARDTALLTEGGYRLGRVIPVDLFPQTYHIESVAVLDRHQP
ncbi:MAG TPA: 23S rRNA (uracil(1939)-C(5))-methyltransferase RlmD [Kiritimatiellia bacterium]|nr:23S rRNA (uracil(1939)-C(5))-methyltransferase RlmD [Kiritimatiellia bacterium]